MKALWGITFAALALVGGFSQWQFFRPVSEGVTHQVAEIPREIGPWQGQDLPLDERTYEILETRNVLFREYRHPSFAPATLCVVFSQANRKAPHPPEVCYTGAGAHVDRRRPEQLTAAQPATSVPGNSLFIQYSRTQEVVLYWYLAGTQLTSSYYDQQAKVMWAQLTGQPAQSAILRYSTVMAKNESQEEAMIRLKEFAQASLPTILDHLTGWKKRPR